MRLRLTVSVVLVLALLLGAHKASAAEAAGGRAIDLFTIGYGRPMYARYGHSLLCVMQQPATDPEAGDCYDFGVPNPAYADGMIWHSYRGKPVFITLRITYAVMLDTIKAQDRTIERQRLPLATDEVARLAAALEGSVSRGDTYWYQPGQANCATKVRDILNDATGDRLRRGTTPTVGLNYRELLDEGLTGHPLELALVALTSGHMNERRPDSWEIQFLPLKLRDAVETRYGVKPEKVYERVEYRLQTSTAVGRGLLVVIGVFLAVGVGFARKDATGRRLAMAQRFTGLFLGGLALLLDLVALTCAYVETHGNWVLLVLLPTDLALGWIPRRHVAKYVIPRLALLGVLVVLEIVGVVNQLVIPVAVMVALPLLGVLRASGVHSPDDGAQDRAPVSAAVEGSR